MKPAFPTKHVFIEQYGSTFNSLLANCEDITNDESKIFPKPSGNCLNWVVGHIIDSRNIVLEMMHQKPVWDNSKLSCYSRGSVAIDNVEKFLPFNELLEKLKSSQNKLTKGIDSVKNDDSEIFKWLTTFCFHEAYHSGQTGILRRIIGKEGKIK